MNIDFEFVERQLSHLLSHEEIEFFISCCEALLTRKRLKDVADLNNISVVKATLKLRELKSIIQNSGIEGIPLPSFHNRRFVYSGTEGLDGLLKTIEKKEDNGNLKKTQMVSNLNSVGNNTELNLKLTIESLRNDKRLLQSERKELIECVKSYKSLTSSFVRGVEALPQIDYVPSVNIVSKPIYEEVTVMFSDFHINRVTSSLELEGINEYNFHIFANRYWFLINELVNITENFRKGNHVIDILNIDFLGDILNDIHRDDNKETNQFANQTAILRGAHVIAQGINILMRYFKSINIYGIIGNEARNSKEKKAKRKYNNGDYTCYQYLSAFLAPYIANDRIAIRIPLSPKLVVDRMSRKILLSHGDDIRAWGGLPVYGITKSQLKELKKRRKMGGFDYWELGHFHTANELNSREVLVNGSLCGSDEYSTNVLGYDGPPIQKFYGINEKYGISWVYDLNVSEASTNSFKYSIDEQEDILGISISELMNVGIGF